MSNQNLDTIFVYLGNAEDPDLKGVVLVLIQEVQKLQRQVDNLERQTNPFKFL